MKDYAGKTCDDFPMAILADEERLILDFEEEAAGIKTCDHCGHCPCGCGG